MTINILSTTTSGTNTTDGISFNNTHITSFPPPIDDSSEYYVLSNNGSSDVVYTSNNLESENIITLTFSPNTLCFNQGTKILCMNQQLADEYIAIELLNVGDFVKTFKHGYRKIDLIYKGSFVNDVNNFHNCMYILPSVINDLGDIKKNTGVFSTIDKDWKEIRKNIDNVTLMSNVTDQYPDDVPPAYSLIGGSKKRTKKQKGKKSKKSNSKK